MPEAPVDSSTSPTCIVDKLPTPPRSTPSPDATDAGSAELKLSRKREREVSLEPATPTASDADPFIRERKYSCLPLKKNKRVLDTTEEEEDNAVPTGDSGSRRSASGSPSDSHDADSVLLASSPRREMKRKVRQISQGVEDINWKGPVDPTLSDKDVDIDSDNCATSKADVTNVVQVPNGKAKGHEVCCDDDDDKADEDETPPKTPPEESVSVVPDLRNTGSDVAMQVSPKKTEEEEEDARHLQISTESNDKGLKRKFLERGTSQGPEESGESGKQVNEPLKRPRDDADKDDNPRETKRPSPPPSPTRLATSSSKMSKPSGFIAYASTSSPFASVKGQNIFSSHSNNNKPSTSTTTPTPKSPKLPELGSAFGSSPSTPPAPVKRSGFEAFASSSSPFASLTRAKSPILGSTSSKLGRAKSPPPPRSRGTSGFAVNAFALYAGSRHGFGVPAQKRQWGESPNGTTASNFPERVAIPVTSVFRGGTSQESGDDEEGDEEEQRRESFSERLRSTKDDEDSYNEGNKKPKLTEQDVMTGEEEEETIHQVRGKLFELQGNSWKERGMGVLKLNVRQEDGTGARLVMRKDAVYTLLLNVTLFHGMHCTLAQDPRYLRFTAIENGVATTYNLKMSDAKVAQDLLEEINGNIPLSSSS